MRRLERLCALWALAGGLLLILIMVMTTINAAAFALARLAASVGGSARGLPGYEDVVQLAIASAVPMFLPFCQIRRGHIAVDFVSEMLPNIAQKALDRLWLATTAVLAVFLAFWLVSGLVQSMSDQTVSPVLGWPLWPSFAPGVVSLALWAVVAVAQFLDTRRDA